MEYLPPGVPVAPFRDRDERHVLETEIREHRHGSAELSGAAVDQHQIRPDSAPVGILPQESSEPAPQHRAQHAGVVPRRELTPVQIELPVLGLLKAFRSRHDHRCHG